MKVLDTASDLEADGDERVEGEAGFIGEGCEGFAKIAAGHQLCDEQNVSRRGGPGFVIPSGAAKLDDMWISQAGSVAKLSSQAVFGRPGIGHSANALDGDWEACVHSAIDDSGSAGAELVGGGASEMDLVAGNDEIAVHDASEIGHVGRGSGLHDGLEGGEGFKVLDKAGQCGVTNGTTGSGLVD